MKILVVEDYHIKERDLRDFVKNHMLSDVEVVVKKSYQGARVCLMKQEFDLILLDMTLPMLKRTTTENGYKINHLAGRDLMEEMKRKGRCFPTIVVTQYRTLGRGKDLITKEALDEELTSRFPTFYLGLVYYQSAAVEWKRDLGRLLEEK